MRRSIPNDPVAKARGNLAVAHRGAGNPEKIAFWREALTAARVEREIIRAGTIDPPLTRAHRERLAKLLLEGGSSA